MRWKKLLIKARQGNSESYCCIGGSCWITSALEIDSVLVRLFSEEATVTTGWRLGPKEAFVGIELDLYQDLGNLARQYLLPPSYISLPYDLYLAVIKLLTAF